MNPLVSSGFNHYQDTLQTGSIIKLYYIVVNIDIDQYRKFIVIQFLPYCPELVCSSYYIYKPEMMMMIATFSF